MSEKKATLSFGKNRLGQYQACIEDENGGFRLAGGKYDGGGVVLFEFEINERGADEIRRYLDAAFPHPQPDGESA